MDSSGCQVNTGWQILAQQQQMGGAGTRPSDQQCNTLTTKLPLPWIKITNVTLHRMRFKCLRVYYINDVNKKTLLNEKDWNFLIAMSSDIIRKCWHFTLRQSPLQQKFRNFNRRIMVQKCDFGVTVTTKPHWINRNATLSQLPTYGRQFPVEHSPFSSFHMTKIA